MKKYTGNIMRCRDLSGYLHGEDKVFSPEFKINNTVYGIYLKNITLEKVNSTLYEISEGKYVEEEVYKRWRMLPTLVDLSLFAMGTKPNSNCSKFIDEKSLEKVKILQKKRLD